MTAPAAPLRIVFMGTPPFVVPVLEALLQTQHKVVAVYTQPPRPAGRGHKLQNSPVHERAIQSGLDVRHPKSLKSAEEQAAFAALDADVAVVAGYGLLLPKAVLTAPKYGCINVHTSLLPRWRGASPVQYAIWKGDAITGVTIMKMDVGMDTGDMIVQESCAIAATDTSATLYDKLFKMGAARLPAILDDVTNITAKKQDDALATPAPMLHKDDAKIDWSQPASAIDRQIRAFTPWPGTFTTIGGKRIKIIAGIPEDGTGAAGTMLDRDGRVACGHGVLRLLKVQPDGGKPMDIPAAINGGYLQIGDVLGRE